MHFEELSITYCHYDEIFREMYKSRKYFADIILCKPFNYISQYFPNLFLKELYSYLSSSKYILLHRERKLSNFNILFFRKTNI